MQAYKMASWDERMQDQARRNKKRLARYWAVSNDRIKVRELTLAQYVELITPAWLKRQAD